MINPRLEINLAKIYANARNVIDKCTPFGISVTGVTKSFCAYQPIVKTMLEAGITTLADSRIYNLIALREAGIDAQLLLLRIPMRSEIADLVALADMSLNSELSIIQAISKEAERQKKEHGVILMVDTGDLREGIWPDQVVETAVACSKLPGVKLRGIATNYGCFGGILPTITNTQIMAELAPQIEQAIGHRLEMVSVGGTVAFPLVEKGIMPAGINNIRIGEAITMGIDTSHRESKIAGACQDAFTLVIEVIEVKDKPSLPVGETGYDAFTGIPAFADRGIRRRAIGGLGKQDMFLEAIYSKVPGIEILGASSDHLLLDVTDCLDKIKIGDEISFGITWSNMLRLTTSPYVRKVVV